jgi:hypothetical protein
MTEIDEYTGGLLVGLGLAAKILQESELRRQIVEGLDGLDAAQNRSPA